MRSDMERTSENDASHLSAMSCELGELSQADGSALLTHCETSVLAAAYGPCEVKIAKEILDRATVEVVCKPKAGLPNCADKFREQLIRGVFQTSLLVTLHPRSSITIVLQELVDNGAFLATSINAACLALLDAGVSMKYLVAAVTAVIDEQGNIMLAPQENPPSEDISASLTIVFNDKDYDILGCTPSGNFSEDHYDRCIVLCREASKNVFQFYRDILEKKLSKLL